jgi:hypothetical protein
MLASGETCAIPRCSPERGTPHCIRRVGHLREARTDRPQSSGRGRGVPISPTHSPARQTVFRPRPSMVDPSTRRAKRSCHIGRERRGSLHLFWVTASSSLSPPSQPRVTPPPSVPPAPLAGRCVVLRGCLVERVAPTRRDGTPPRDTLWVAPSRGRLLTTRDMADYLGLSPETVLRRWGRHLEAGSSPVGPHRPRSRTRSGGIVRRPSSRGHPGLPPPGCAAA